MNDWTEVDEGWGRHSVEFATLSEPANFREYLALHQLLDISRGDRVLDIACGAGLALELAALRGAECAGIDASQRLIAVAQDRSPNADIRVGDMFALPWEDDTFDVVTSFRGIWGTTPEALDEARRVLKPGDWVSRSGDTSKHRRAPGRSSRSCSRARPRWRIKPPWCP
jgi:ubiquinone/menaquinone biosynthesis C-methylase UbiE